MIDADSQKSTEAESSKIKTPNNSDRDSPTPEIQVTEPILKSEEPKSKGLLLVEFSKSSFFEQKSQFFKIYNYMF